MSPPPPDQTKPSPHRFLVPGNIHPARKFKPPSASTIPEPSTHHPSKRLKVIEQPSGLPVVEALRSTAPRFVLSQNSGEDRARPTFVNPSATSDATVDPRPEVFSPHRKGQRFVAGGMAAELSSWLTGLDRQSIMAHTNLTGVDEADFAAVIRVEACHGEDALFVTGKSLQNIIVKAVLVQNPAQAEHNSSLPPATCIGIREPTWQVEVASHNWTVATDWCILQVKDR